MDAKAIIEEAKAAADQNDLEFAQTILNDFIQQDPLNVEAWLTLADMVQNPDEAIQCLERVLKLQPENGIAREKLSKLNDPFSDLFMAWDSRFEPGLKEQIQMSDQIETPQFSTGQQSSPHRAVPIQANTYQPRSGNLFNTPQVQKPEPMPTSQLRPPPEDIGSERFQQALAGSKTIVETPKKKTGNCTLIAILAIIIMGLSVAVLLLIVQNPSSLNLGSEQPVGDVRDMIYLNMDAANTEDLDLYMDTIHPKASGRIVTKLAMQNLFNEYDLSYKVSALEVIAMTEEEARVTFELTTRKLSGPAFQDNWLSGIMILRLDDGKWKIYDQEVLDVVYLR